MFLNKRYRYRCVLLEAVLLLLLLSLFSGTTTALLFPNGQQCQFASDCESGACLATVCVDKRPLGELCTLEAPCANPENTTCNFQTSFLDGFCEVAKKAGDVCSNSLPQRRCIEPQLACIQRSSSEPPAKCLIVLSNGQEIPEPKERFVCDTKFTINFLGSSFCSDGNPDDVCLLEDQCGGPACFKDKCFCDGAGVSGNFIPHRCVKLGLDGEDCFNRAGCLKGLKCLIVRGKCTAGELGSPCTVNIDCGTVVGSVLECSGGFCVKRGGIGQPCTGGAFGAIQGSCANGLRCSGRRGTCGCRPVLGCP